MTEWLDIWEVDPIGWEDIQFKTGNEQSHIGILYYAEKLRKCKFFCYSCVKYYECDGLTDLSDRVTHWAELPAPPNSTYSEEKGGYIRGMMATPDLTVEP
jgi:hypothetical protein